MPAPRLRRQTGLSLSVAGLALFLGACGVAPSSLQPDVAGAAAMPTPQTAAYHVDHIAVRHDMRVPPGAIGLGSVELASLDGFLTRAQARRGDVVHISTAGAMPFARSRLIADYLAGRGLRLGTVSQMAGPEDAVSLTVERAIYVPTACLGTGIAEGPVTSFLPNRQFTGLLLPPGCANAMNLARMVADPADLGLGRPLAPALGDREALGVDLYRTTPATPFTEEVAAPTEVTTE